jgi:hypothetical protein
MQNIFSCISRNYGKVEGGHEGCGRQTQDYRRGAQFSGGNVGQGKGELKEIISPEVLQHLAYRYF